MVLVAQARPSERAEFIKKTYLHLAGAVAAFIVVEFLLFQLGIAQALGQFVAQSGFGFRWKFLLCQYDIHSLNISSISYAESIRCVFIKAVCYLSVVYSRFEIFGTSCGY